MADKHIRAMATTVLNQLCAEHPREDLDLDAVRALATSALAQVPEQVAGDSAWLQRMAERVREAHDASLDGDHKLARVLLLGIYSDLTPKEVHVDNTNGEYEG